MHHLIVFVVEAEDADEAVLNASGELDEIIEKGGPPYIDYGTFFSADGVNGHSVKNWGAKKAAANLEDEEGRFWLMRNLLIDYQYYQEALDEVKKILSEQTPSQIYEDNNLSMYRFRKIDSREWVVCESDFVSFHQLRRFLEDKDAKNVWIVPCDVHT